jgi:hypothetical protein
MTTRPVYVFTDLDDTLFQTRSKCGDGPVHEAAYDKEGQALSYHTEEQLALLSLFGQTTLIPVTGRNLAALGRVRSVSFSWVRITSHGALVLGPDERLLPSWERVLNAEMPKWSVCLSEALAHARDRIKLEGLSLRAKLIHDQDIPVYVSIKGESAQVQHMARTLEPLWREGVIHRNGHNMALLPPFACKARAVEHVMGLIRESASAPPLFVGFGDSVTDLPFLKLCHFALTPRGSQIHQEAWI